MLTADLLRQIVKPPVAVAVARDPSRRDRETESRLGRKAAREALASLGVDTEVLDAGSGLWPEDTVVSIAHSAGTAVAVAARAVDRAAVGIDIEPIGRRLSARVIERIATGAERAWLDGDNDMPLVLFCAKEATYKALSRFEHHPVAFADVVFERSGANRLAGRVVASAAPFAPMPKVIARTATAGGFCVAFVEVGVDVIPRASALSGREETALGVPDSH